MFQNTLSLARRNVMARSLNESNPSIKGIQTKPIYISIHETKDVPLCINCKYYSPSKMVKEARLGECRKFGKMNVIDGAITYEVVEVARQYFCHGNQYEEINRKEVDPESHKAFLK